MTRNIAILPCAGVGKRFHRSGKLYLKLGNLSILARTLTAFIRCKDIHVIILAAHPQKMKAARAVIQNITKKKNALIVAGGKTRQESVWNGMKAAEKLEFPVDIVVVHDGARPFVTSEMISLSIREAKKHGGCIFAVPSKDTLKEEKRGFVSKTLPREKIVSAQTPQTFQYDILRKAFLKAQKDGFTGTDESSLVERMDGKVKILLGSYKNIKITTQEDFLIARAFVKNKP